MIINEDAFLAELPASLRRKVVMRLYADVIKRVPLFKSIGDNATVSICAALRPVVAPLNELIVREGESASAIYFIIDGTCRVSVRGITLGHLRSGGFFGEMAILGTESDSRIQNRTVWAQTDCQLRYLEVKDLHIEEKDLAIIRGTLKAYSNKRSKADSKRIGGLAPAMDADTVTVVTEAASSASPTVIRSHQPAVHSETPVMNRADLDDVRERQQRCEDAVMKMHAVVQNVEKDLSRVVKHLGIRS